MPSGDVGSTWSIRGNSTSTKTAASGLYTWWADPNHASIGIQSAAPGANTFTTIQVSKGFYRLHDADLHINNRLAVSSTCVVLVTEPCLSVYKPCCSCC